MDHINLNLNLHPATLEPVSELPGMDICSPSEFQCIDGSDLDFTAVLTSAAAHLSKRPRKDPDVWNETKVLLLLAWMVDLAPIVKNTPRHSNKLKVWTEIRRRFDKEGHQMTVKQISNKYASLVRQYEKVMRHNRETGENRFCAYQNELKKVRSVWPKGIAEPLIVDDSSSDSTKRDFNAIDDNIGLNNSDDDETTDHRVWPDDQVQFLLSSIDELLPKVGATKQFSTKIKMFEEITERFQQRGYSVTMRQVMNKYTSLARQYKKALTHSRVNGKPLSCAYKDELEKIVATHKKRLSIEEAIEYHQEQNNATQMLLSEDDHSNATPRSNDTERNNLHEIRENYYKEKAEYYQRRKLHLQRKEEHMQRKETLLAAVLSKLQGDVL